MALRSSRKEAEGIAIKAARDASPRLLVTKKTREMARNGPRFRKIHRMQIQHTGGCRIIAVDSPNLIWAKFHNDITSQLQYKCPHLLLRYKIPEDDKMFADYVMAPTDEETYARARIIKFHPDEKNGGFFCLVVFLDYGTCDWVHSDALAEMDNVLFYNPWQAFAFSLFGLIPGEEFDQNGVPRKLATWTEEQLEILRSIIGSFEKFSIESVITLKDRVKEEVYPFKLYAFEDSRKIDIAHVFAMQCRRAGYAVEYDQKMVLGSDNRLFPLNFDDEPMLDEKSLPLWKRQISSIWGFTVPGSGNRKTLDEGTVRQHEYVAPLPAFDSKFKLTTTRPTPLIRLYDEELLNKTYRNPRYDGLTAFLMMSTNEESLEEFFVMPITSKSSLQSVIEEIGTRTAYNAIAELDKFSTSLDAFYIEQSCRVPLDPKITANAIIDGVVQYGIHEVSQNMDLSHGRFRRVMLCDLKLISEEHCDIHSWVVKVVFVDFGGSDWVPLNSLYQIHTKHTLREPFCVQVCASNLVPGRVIPSSLRGHSKLNEILVKVLREIVPTTRILLGNLQVKKGSHTQMVRGSVTGRPNLMTLTHMEVKGKSEALEKTLVEHCMKAFLAEMD